MRIRPVRRALGRLGLALALAGHGPWAMAADLTIATARSSLSLPLWVAQERGFFEAEGVRPQLAECIGGQRCMKAMFDGQADLATASELPVMFNSFQRSDYAVVATFAATSNDVKLITRRSAGIAAGPDLKGRRVGVVRGASSQYFLDAWLLFNDVDPRGVQLVPLAPEAMAGAIQRKEVDAVSIWEPMAWSAMQALGADALVLSTPTIYTQTFNLVALQRTRSERQPALRAVLRSLARAQRFIHERPREAQALMMQRLGVDQGFIDWAWKDIDFRLGLEQSLLSTLEAEARWAVREGHVPAGSRPPNYLQFIDPAPLRAAAPDAPSLLR